MPAYYGDFVTPTALCTPADVAAYTGTTAPTNATALIRSATRLVLRETRQAYYVVDPLTGLATDTQILGALHDATVIQVVVWAQLGYDPLTGGVQTPSVESSTKMLSSSITFADAALSAQARADALKHLVPEAEELLELQNLLIPNPWTFG
jgi:hypothetical protein